MKHFGMAYAMKKKHGAHMCHGGECDHPSHFAEGGESLHHSPAGGSANRSKGAERFRAEGKQEGVNRSRSVYSPGESGMGYSVRAGDTESAKKMAYQTIKEQRNVQKPHGEYAEGGSVLDDTHRWENENGINKVASGDKPGRSEAGASLHPAFSIGEDIDKEVAKRRHHKTLAEMRSMPKPKLMAEGGEMKSKRERAMHAFAGGGMMTNEGYQSHGKPEVDGDLMPAAHLKEELGEHVAHEPTHDSMVSHDVMNQMGDEDEGEGDMNMIDPLIKKIMMGRAKGYSEGGKVANEESGESSDEPTMAKWEGNEFDDLALRDDLEFKSTGANAGDEEDDLSEAHDRDDIVKRVMKSRGKKDRMPRPA